MSSVSVFGKSVVIHYCSHSLTVYNKELSTDEGKHTSKQAIYLYFISSGIPSKTFAAKLCSKKSMQSSLSSSNKHSYSASNKEPQSESA